MLIETLTCLVPLPNCCILLFNTYQDKKNHTLTQVLIATLTQVLIAKDVKGLVKNFMNAFVVDAGVPC